MDCSIRSLWIALDSVVQRALGQTMLTDLFRSEQAMNVWVQPQREGASGVGTRSLSRCL